MYMHKDNAIFNVLLYPIDHEHQVTELQHVVPSHRPGEYDDTLF
jgi:hypothetical protein